MVYQKDYFFKNSTEAKETLLNRVIKKSRKAVSFTKSVTIDYVKSRVVRTQIQIDRSNKICWAIESKTKEYYESDRLKRYSTCDIHNMVNCMYKKMGAKTYASSTLRGNIRILNEMGLIKTFQQYLGEGNGGFAFYVINYKKWRHYKTIIKNYFERKLINDFADKRIKGSFEKKIDSAVFDDADDIESEETQAVRKEIQGDVNKTETSCVAPLKRIEQDAGEKLSNSALPNSAFIPEGIISLTKYKNSKKSIFEKNEIEQKKNKRDNYRQLAIPDLLEEKKKRISKKSGYRKTYEEYMETRLEAKYGVSRKIMNEIKVYSNNMDTYKNALRNFEAGLVGYCNNYFVKHISEHFTTEFTQEYKGKVWMMNPNTSKTNDFNKIWGRFTDKYVNKHKQQERNMRITYCDGYGNTSQVDANGHFVQAAVKPIGSLLDNFKQALHGGGC
nr:plasmid maintenance protein [Borrelia sp. BU AG58]